MMPLTEPLVIQDVYVSGLADVEPVGDGNYRFTFYTRQRSTYDGASIDNVVVARLVLPSSAIITAMKLTAMEVGLNCVDIGQRAVEFLQ